MEHTNRSKHLPTITYEYRIVWQRNAQQRRTRIYQVPAYARRFAHRLNDNDSKFTLESVSFERRTVGMWEPMPDE